MKIPAGIATGQRLRLQNEGEHGSAGGPPGDLYVVVHVQDHHFFHRENDDLFCELPISYPTLALGGSIKVPTLNGREDLHIPAGTQAGARFKMRGKGMPNVSGRGHGDLHVIAGVAIPTKLSKEQKSPARRAVEDAAEAGGRPRSSGRERQALLRARQGHLWLSFAALDLRWRSGPGAPERRTCELLHAQLDEFEPQAIHDDESADGWRVFFRSARHRDDAAAALRATLGDRLLTITAVDVPDEEWARRSQANLTAIRVGRIVVAPPWHDSTASPPELKPADGDIAIVIDPSTGFGTGHHETTRLCLSLLQSIELRDRRVIDVGTGSGVLAIAAAKLGAASVVAFDEDPEALRNARENVARNDVAELVEVREAMLSSFQVEPAGRRRGQPDRCGDPEACGPPDGARRAWRGRSS